MVSEAMDTFEAIRRGKGVLIRATVRRPGKNVVPWIERYRHESKPGWRYYRLCWGTSIGGLPRSAPDPTEVDYLDSDVPVSIKNLCIYLPGGGEVIIKSQR